MEKDFEYEEALFSIRECGDEIEASKERTAQLYAKRLQMIADVLNEMLRGRCLYFERDKNWSNSDNVIINKINSCDKMIFMPVFAANIEEQTIKMTSLLEVIRYGTEKSKRVVIYDDNHVEDFISQVNILSYFDKYTIGGFFEWFYKRIIPTEVFVERYKKMLQESIDNIDEYIY